MGRIPHFRYTFGMSIAKKILWNTGVQVAGKAISTILGVWLIILMTRSLGTEGFGAYTTANTYLQFFALFLDMGLNVTLIALLGEHADDEAYQKRCISALFTLRIFLSIIILLGLAPALIWLTDYPTIIKVAVFALAGSFVFPSINQVVVGAQQKALKLEPASIAEVIGRIVSIIGIHIAIAYGQGLIAMTWIITFASGCLFAYNIYHASKHANFYWNWDPIFWKMALKRSWPVGLTILLGLLYFKADTLILSRVRPLDEVGLYGAAYRVFEVLITVPFMYAGIILPILSSHWKKQEKQAFSSILTHSIDGMLFLAIPLIFGSALLGKEVLVAISGESFADAGRVLSILSLAIAVTYINTVFSHAVIAVDAQRKMIVPYIITSFIALVSYLYFIPIYGMWAAAWLTVIFETLILIANATVTHLSQNIIFKPKAGILSLIACLPMTAVILMTRDFWVGIPVVIGAIAYLVTALALGAIPKELLKDLKNKNTTSVT